MNAELIELLREILAELKFIARNSAPYGFQDTRRHVLPGNSLQESPEKIVTVHFSTYTDENGNQVEVQRKITSQNQFPSHRPNEQESVCPTCGTRRNGTEESRPVHPPCAS